MFCDVLYSPGVLWGQSAADYHQDRVKFDVPKYIHFARHIILTYHLGLQSEAISLWLLFSKRIPQLKLAESGKLSQAETKIRLQLVQIVG